MGTLDIGLTALSAHSRALEVTAHNIANAATPGYSRQRAELGTQIPQSLTPGQLGRGVLVSAIVSMRDQLLSDRLRQASSADGRLTMLQRTLVDTELVFNEPGDTGFASTVDSLFASLESLSGNPESSALRGAAVQQLRTVATTINDLGVRLRQQSESLGLSAEGEVQQVNGILDQIVTLNEQIRREVLVGRNPNDLLDRRDELAKSLAGSLGIRVRLNPDDQTMYVEADGRLIVGGDQAQHLAIAVRDDGTLAVSLAATGEVIDAGSGTLQALVEMSTEILPQVVEGLDNLAIGLMRQFNGIQATGTNHLTAATAFVSSAVFTAGQLTANLDDADAMAFDRLFGNGIPELLQASFTDAAGAPRASTLSINLVNQATGVAEKFIVRYDPGSGPVAASRSIDDLASAINSGRGGGFSVEPSYAGKVAHLTASLVPVSGGYRLQLAAETGYSLDFSRAMDVRPADHAWTGAAVAIAGTDAALANQRLLFRVNGVGGLDAFTLDPDTGAETAYAGTLTATPAGALGAAGESFAIDLDSTGAPLTAAVSAAWTAGDAGFQVTGRYTGSQSWDASRQWSARVLRSGTIGATGNAAPIVEFTWYSGTDEVPVAQTTTVTLDGDLPAGSQIPIGDGLYAVFDAGDLTTGAPSALALMVDGSGDQAGLLPALGINGMFTGSDAETLKVSADLLANADLLAVAHSRSPGDNANVALLTSVRDLKVFGPNALSFDDYYQGFVSDIGVRIQQTEQLAENQAQVTRSLENRRDEVAGVSIDEEVGALILQQQAYAAAARIITVAQENIRTLMDVLG